jgi:hypothetical protein
MSLDTLPVEILFYILGHLKFRDKISFISVCKEFRELKRYVDLDFFVKYNDVKDSPFFNNYTHVIYNEFPKKVPDRIKAIVIQEINENVVAAIKNKNIIDIYIDLKNTKYENLFLLSNLTRLRNIYFFNVSDVDMHPNLKLLSRNIRSIESIFYGCFNVSYRDWKCITRFNIYVKIRVPDIALTEYYLIYNSEKIGLSFESIDNLEVLEIYQITCIKLPQTLKVLRTGKIKKNITLPDSIEVLKCDKARNLKHCTKLRELECNKVFFPLPDSIQDLTVYDNIYCCKLPSQLKKLNVTGKVAVNDFPESLEKIDAFKIYRIECNGFFYSLNESNVKFPNLSYLNLTESSQLPFASMPCLRKLIVHRYTGRLDNLPESLEVLDIDNVISSDISIPPKLRVLSLRNYFNCILPDLPDTLKVLELGDIFNRPIQKLPKYLEVLSLGNSFNQDLPHLPDSLLELKIGNSFNKQIREIPKCLKVLSLGDAFNKHLPRLPDSLIKLSIGNSFNKRIKRLPEKIKLITLGKSYIKRFPERSKSYLNDSSYNLFCNLFI